MKTLSKKSQIDAFLSKLQKRGDGVSDEILSSVNSIINSVRKQGDRALLKYTKKFDGHDKIKLTPANINKYAKQADPKVLEALEISAKRIRKFHKLQKESSWTVKEEGITLGQLVRPLKRVGIYVPGGKASYPSSVLMNVIAAQVAGVSEIAITVPTPGGIINPEVMAAIKMLGITEVYTVGGAQAVAALAYGTTTIAQVDKITGPGNIYVSTAKRMVFGQVDIDMIAGPSEIMVVADSSGDASFIAADMLSQSEHDELASSVLVTDSATLAGGVNKELRAQLKTLLRKDIASKSLSKYGAIIVVKDMQSAIDIANKIAPEHLEIMTRSPRKHLDAIQNAGAAFLGKWTPEPLGDYSAGPNHTLPTGGTARFSSALGVYDFMKKISLLEFTRAGLMSLQDPVVTLATSEGLQAHARSVTIRTDKITKK